MRKTDKYRQTPQFCGVRPLLFFLRAPHAGSERIAPFICSLTDFSLVNFFSSASNRMRFCFRACGRSKSGIPPALQGDKFSCRHFYRRVAFYFFAKPLDISKFRTSYHYVRSYQWWPPLPSMVKKITAALAARLSFHAYPVYKKASVPPA